MTEPLTHELPAEAAGAPLREAVKVLHGMSDDLADGVLNGEQPEGVGDVDWEVANEDFAAALAAMPAPIGPEYIHGKGDHDPSDCDICSPASAIRRERAMPIIIEDEPTAPLDVEAPVRAALALLRAIHEPCSYPGCLNCAEIARLAAARAAATKDES